MKKRADRVTRADLERLLDLLAWESLSAERSEQDLKDVVALGLATHEELDRAAERSWNRVQSALRPTVAGCLAASMTKEGLRPEHFATQLEAPISAVEQLLTSAEPVDKETLRAVSLKLSSLLGLDYARLVCTLGSALGAFYATRGWSPRRVLTAARQDRHHVKPKDTREGDVR